MSILVTGSLAYDYVMAFPDSFRNHILPDQLHILNVCFTVEELKKNLGGCAGNMAHTIKLLEEEPIILAILGSDSEPYLNALTKHNIRTDHIATIETTTTASAHITTDKDDNQVAAFFVGAMHRADDLSRHDVKEDIDLAIIGPNKKEAMIKFAKECQEHRTPVVMDPGQMIPTFSKEEMLEMIDLASHLIANDYEMKLIQDKTGLRNEEIKAKVDVLITTLGSEGSRIETADETIEVGVCPVLSVEDPTGAGDAYRGGFFSALQKGKDLKICGQVGAVAAAYAVEHHGTQTFSYTMSDFAERYEGAFGEALSW